MLIISQSCFCLILSLRVRLLTHFGLLCVCFVACQAVFHTAILNDTLFLNVVNIVDYSIVVGLGEERRELVRLVWSSPSLYSLEGIYASTC